MNSPGVSNSKIWSSFKKGEDWAVSFIYSENAEKLYRYGLKFTSDSALVEDVLQDLFAELIKNRKSLGDTDNILFYLLKSFKRKMLRKIQTEKRYDPKEEMEAYNFEVTWPVENDIILAEVLEQKSRMLLKALNELTPRQKEAIYLRFTKELDYNEVAGMLDISVESCRNLISKAISTLKKWVLEKWQGLTVFFFMFF